MATSDDERRKLHTSSGNNSLEDEEYIKKYDGYKPRFTGIPEGYYPNTWGNIILILCLLGLLYCFAAGIFAFNLWLLFVNTITVPWVYAGIGFGYTIFVIGAIFIGQTKRNELERKFMDDALAHAGDKNATSPNAI